MSLASIRNSVAGWFDGAVIGRLGERQAARYLRRRGLRIIGRNLRAGRGEIDLVALEGRTVVFVEVKSTTQRSFGDGLDKIDRRKRGALRRTCRLLLATLARDAESYRVDGVCVDYELNGWIPRLVDVRWYPNIVDLD